MRKSRIFTDKELKTIQERLRGNKKDKFGTYARTKKKIIEIVDIWAPQIKKLERLTRDK